MGVPFVKLRASLSRDSWDSTADLTSTAVIHCNHTSSLIRHRKRRRGIQGAKWKIEMRQMKEEKIGESKKGEEMNEKCIGISIISHVSGNEANAVLCGSYK